MTRVIVELIFNYKVAFTAMFPPLSPITTQTRLQRHLRLLHWRLRWSSLSHSLPSRRAAWLPRRPRRTIPPMAITVELTEVMSSSLSQPNYLQIINIHQILKIIIQNYEKLKKRWQLINYLYTKFINITLRHSHIR